MHKEFPAVEIKPASLRETSRFLGAAQMESVIVSAPTSKSLSNLLASVICVDMQQFLVTTQLTAAKDRRYILSIKTSSAFTIR